MKTGRPITVTVIFLIIVNLGLSAQLADPFKPDFNPPQSVKNMKLVWNDEFNTNGKPDSTVWFYENGFVRNNELQWYKKDNASCTGGVLLIEGRKVNLRNPNYAPASSDWKKNREFIQYTSSSINTRGNKQFLYGRFEVRARIDTATGAWPAIWTLGIRGRWPSNGEIDIMEFYRIAKVPTILGNFAWGSEEVWKAKWDDMKIPLTNFTKKDPDWVKKFHVWRMEWDEKTISIFIDDVLINDVSMTETINPDRTNPFNQPHYILLNLAIGANGGDPAKTKFPIKYEIDYVRVYQKE